MANSDQNLLIHPDCSPPTRELDKQLQKEMKDELAGLMTTLKTIIPFDQLRSFQLNVTSDGKNLGEEIKNLGLFPVD